MCAIIGSFSKDKLIELIKLNSYRGSHSYSFSLYNPVEKTMSVVDRSHGEIPKDIISIPHGMYGIVHVQAPTTEAKASSNIHPSVDNETPSYLWHNGIIKAGYVELLQEKYGNDTNWDTELLHRAINDSMEELNSVDGSFSCLWFDRSRLLLFRNEISPMFYDKHLNISSTKFEGSLNTPSNKVLLMDFNAKALYNMMQFTTVDNPYFFMETN